MTLEQRLQRLCLEIIAYPQNETMLRFAQKCAQELIPADGGCVRIVEPKTRVLRLCEEWQASTESNILRPRKISADTGLFAKLLVSGKTEQWNVAELSPQKNKALRAEYSGIMPATVLAVPIFYRRKVLGIWALERMSNNPFTAESARALETLGQALGARLANARLETLSEIDSMTQLSIHRAFKEKLTAEIERARRYQLRFSLALLDIDFFKKINDTYGHLVGDEALRHLSVLLKESLRTVDFCARYGGEEFAALLPDTPSGEALIALERLRKKVETTPFQANNATIPMTISIGICAWTPEENLTLEKLISHTDAALYHSKHQGRNRSTLWPFQQ